MTDPVAAAIFALAPPGTTPPHVDTPQIEEGLDFRSFMDEPPTDLVEGETPDLLADADDPDEIIEGDSDAETPVEDGENIKEIIPLVAIAPDRSAPAASTVRPDIAAADPAPKPAHPHPPEVIELRSLRQAQPVANSDSRPVLAARQDRPARPDIPVDRLPIKAGESLRADPTPARIPPIRPASETVVSLERKPPVNATSTTGSSVTAAALLAAEKAPVQAVPNPAVNPQDMRPARAPEDARIGVRPAQRSIVSHPTQPQSSATLPQQPVLGAKAAPNAPLLNTEPAAALTDEVTSGEAATANRPAGVVQSAQITTAHSLAGPATARHAASQMAIAVTRQNGGATEMALNPPELGKVRLTMNAQDTSIVMMVQAERPETSDMMRRHIDVLAQEFRALGYGNIRFEFGDGTGAHAGSKQNDASAALTEAGEPELTAADTAPLQHQTAAEGGLDLRL